MYRISLNKKLIFSAQLTEIGWIIPIGLRMTRNNKISIITVPDKDVGENKHDPGKFFFFLFGAGRNNLETNSKNH